MKATRIAAAAAVLALAAAGAASHAEAAGLKMCGGQKAAPHAVPYDCQSGPITIDGTVFTAYTHADGTAISTRITMDAPRLVDTPVRISHHIGISKSGPTSATASGVILAGQTEATLTDSEPCRAGQLDIKAVWTDNGDERGRIGGPWIENGSGCTDTTSIPSTAPPPPSSTPPPDTTTQAPPGSTTPTTPPSASTPPSSGPPASTGPPLTLPRTGPPAVLAFEVGTAISLLALGGILLCVLIFLYHRHEKRDAFRTRDRDGFGP